MIKMTDEMKQRVDKAFEEKKYCVWATTSDDGFPDMSFRGSTFVFDDEHLAFWTVPSVPARPIWKAIRMSACFSMTKKTAWAGASTARRRSTRRAISAKRSCAARSKASSKKTHERKGYGVLVRVDKIRGYSGFNVVQER